MYCSVCGKENDFDSRFCFNCGTSLVSDFSPVPGLNNKICPYCRNMCPQVAMLCSVCGNNFGTYYPVQNSAIPQPKVKNTADKCKTVAIVLLVFTVFLNIFSVFADVLNVHFGGAARNPLLYMTLPVIIIIIGLLIGSNNVLPGVGYLLLIFANLLPFVIFDTAFSYFIVFNWIAYAMVSVMFFVKTDFVKKFWFVPAIMSGLYVCCYLIENVSYIIYYEWYYIVMSVIPSAIGSILPFCTLVLVGFVAKELWTADAKTIAPNTVDYIYRI